MTRDELAFDRASVRTKDSEGRLHVARTNISKAIVNPYLGREIPDWQGLGLDPDRVYQLLRDPAELQKAAATFNNLPLLSTHVPVSADDHHPDVVIGSTGTDAKFDAPYLTNSLVVWVADAIEDIESEVKKELSAGYRYRPDMTPGTYEGTPYDGVMRDIIGNHVAIVREGRAGADVVVGDSALTKSEVSLMPMKPLSRKAAVAQGALFAYLRPKLATDAKIDLTPMFAGVTAKNFATKKNDIVRSVKARTAGKLAQDANLDDIVALLDAVETVAIEDAPELAGEAPAAAPADPVDPVAPTDEDDQAVMDEDPLAKVREFLAGKLSDEDIAALMKMLPAPTEAADTGETPSTNSIDGGGSGQSDTTPPNQGNGGGEMNDGATDEDSDADAAKKEKDKDMITKPAMDAAIAAVEKRATQAALKIARDIRDAERHVRPHVGDLAHAYDSAEAVYRGALKVLNYEKADSVPAAALTDVFDLAAKAATAAKSPAREARVAMDAAASKNYAARFPHANRLKN